MLDMAEPKQFLYTRKEAAQSLRISTKTLDRMIADGRLIAVESGGRTMIRTADLEEYVLGLPKKKAKQNAEQ